MADGMAAKQPPRRLGRGLSSLISSGQLPVNAQVSVAPTCAAPDAPDTASITAPTPARTPASIEVAIELLDANPHQPRTRFDETLLKELAASIRSTGLIQPVVVRRVDGRYQLIAGERRWRAARLAGLTHIPALVRDVDPFSQAQMALVENIQREDLNPIDRARSYRALLEQLGLTQAELAGRLGEDRSSIANHLRLLELPPSVLQMVQEGRLTLGHAKLLAGVTDVAEQEQFAKTVVSQELSVRNLERLLKDRQAPDARPTTAQASPHVQDLERTIARQLGMRVQVRSGSRKGKGRIIIHYASLDQFDELMTRLGVRLDE